MDGTSFPERTFLIRRAAARLCLRLGWAPLHEVRLANGRRADILDWDKRSIVAGTTTRSGPARAGGRQPAAPSADVGVRGDLRSVAVPGGPRPATGVQEGP